MKTNFKVGDKVWDDVICHKQEGIIEIIDITLHYPILVRFEDNTKRYTIDGRLLYDRLPTLSKVPYNFELPKQPVEFQEGDPVLVRDSDEFPWIGAKFKRYDNHGFQYVVFESSRYRIAHKYCIPFDIEKMGRV